MKEEYKQVTFGCLGIIVVLLSIFVGLPLAFDALDSDSLTLKIICGVFILVVLGFIGLSDYGKAVYGYIFICIAGASFFTGITEGFNLLNLAACGTSALAAYLLTQKMND